MVIPSNVRFDRESGGNIRFRAFRPAFALFGLALGFSAFGALPPMLQLPPDERLMAFGVWLPVTTLGWIVYCSSTILEISPGEGRVRLGWGWRQIWRGRREGRCGEVTGIRIVSFQSLTNRPLEGSTQDPGQEHDCYRLSLNWGEDVPLFESSALDGVMFVALELSRAAGWPLLEAPPEGALVEGPVSPRDLLTADSVTRSWKQPAAGAIGAFTETPQADGVRVEVTPLQGGIRWFMRAVTIVFGLGPLLYYAFGMEFFGDLPLSLLLMIQLILWVQLWTLSKDIHGFGEWLVIKRDGVTFIQAGLWFADTVIEIPGREIVSLRLGNRREGFDPVGTKDNQQKLIIETSRMTLEIGVRLKWKQRAWLRRKILASLFPSPE